MLYSDDEEKAFEDSRAVTLTDLWAVRGDLARRSLVARLNPIVEHARWTESDLKEEFEKEQPLVFCALRNDILEGLRRNDDVKLERLLAPRRLHGRIRKRRASATEEVCWRTRSSARRCTIISSQLRFI